VAADGSVKCWGSNDSGQLGNGTTVNSSIPVAVSGLSGVISIVAHASSTCALLDTGRVKCWGYSGAGNLGDGSAFAGAVTTPVDVRDLGDVVQIAAGREHTCAVDGHGALFCWGENYSAELGTSVPLTSGHSAVPVPSKFASGATSVACGDGYTCAVAAGAVSCWGNPFGARLNTPPSDANAVRSGYLDTCAVTEAGAMRCWGTNGAGQVGNRPAGLEDVDDHQEGTPLRSGVVDAAGGFVHVCALVDGGGIRCLGGNAFGQLGDGVTPIGAATDSFGVPVASTHVPTHVQGISSDAIEVAAGWWTTCAMLSDGSVRCWGRNREGQLGHGTTSDGERVPVAVLNIP
jgi:alpha-tubulin suppressor-like RCC1 family protein